MKHGSIQADELIAKATEYGLLKIRIPSIKDRYTLQKSEYDVLFIDEG
jgi:hypothetical protein